MPTTTKPVTYEEWLEMPLVDDEVQEVVNGEIVTMPPPKARHADTVESFARSEERRVGKECRYRWWPDHKKKKCKQRLSWKQQRNQHKYNALEAPDDVQEGCLTTIPAPSTHDTSAFKESPYRGAYQDILYCVR